MTDEEQLETLVRILKDHQGAIKNSVKALEGLTTSVGKLRDWCNELDKRVEEVERRVEELVIAQ